MGLLAERRRRKRRARFMNEELPGWLTKAMIFGTLATVAVLEIKRPLRKQEHSKKKRDTRNVAMSLMTAATIAVAEKPVVSALAKRAENERRGLLKMWRLPVWLEMVLSVVLLDYTLYIWHYLTHRVPLLWRFHQVHHVDLDLDASTALRFHAVEMLLSVPYRMAQVALFGVSARALQLWQTLTLMEILFHHSNSKLPFWLEKWLCRFIVTPRMHGIHHSIVRKETDSNWSTIFSWPDYLHRTIRLNVPQDEVTIGVAGFRDPQELTLDKLLQMPATADRPSWQLPGDGTPQREETPLISRWHLAE